MFLASCRVPGVITVNETGKVPPSQIPSLVGLQVLQGTEQGDLT